MKYYLLFLIFSLHVTSINAQFVFDEYFYGNFEPFNYNEANQTFTINLGKTCDPQADGSFDATNLETKGFSAGRSRSWKMSNYVKGESIHYGFRKHNGKSSSTDPNTCAYGGVELNHDEKKGRLLILINDELYNDIRAIINEYKIALIGDGWKVSIITVSSDELVSVIKQEITTIYNQIGDLRSIFIIGEVPIPYSVEDIHSDGHLQHQGAWMADEYYSDLDGNWTDDTANNESSLFERHRNVPGDGEFDQTYCPSSTELEIGRIYFENLPIYLESTINKSIVIKK